MAFPQPVPDVIRRKADNPITQTHPLPHDGCLPFKRATAGIRKTYGASIPLVPIGNGQVILVDESGMRIVWKA